MYKHFLFICLLVSIYSCSSIKKNYWVGFDKVSSKSMYGELIHKNHLLLKGDSAFLYKEPYYVKNGDTICSASDGGYYFYRGKIIEDKKRRTQYLHLTLVNCDYCIRETLVDSITGHELFKPKLIRWNIKMGEKLIVNNIKYEIQLSKRFPIDMISFYENTEFVSEESQEVEFTE